MDGKNSDPDIEFGVLINQTIQPKKIYEGIIRVYEILPNVFQIQHAGMTAQLQTAEKILQQTFPGSKVDVWETTRINEYAFVTTVVVTQPGTEVPAQQGS